MVDYEVDTTDFLSLKTVISKGNFYMEALHKNEKKNDAKHIQMHIYLFIFCPKLPQPSLSFY